MNFTTASYTYIKEELMNTAIELGISTTASTGIALAVNAEPLITALIALGISLVTVVGGELVKFLTAWLKSKREKIEKGEEKDE